MTRRRHRIAVAAAAVTLVSCGLAVVGAYALYNVDKHAAGTAVAIALPAAVVFSVVLAWLFSRDRNGGAS
jgi:uncharacterized membrane protein